MNKKFSLKYNARLTLKFSIYVKNCDNKFTQRRGWARKIKVNDFYRRVRLVLCKWHAKTAQDRTFFFKFTHFNSKNVASSNSNLLDIKK